MIVGVRGGLTSAVAQAWRSVAEEWEWPSKTGLSGSGRFLLSSLFSSSPPVPRSIDVPPIQLPDSLLSGILPHRERELLALKFVSTACMHDAGGGQLWIRQRM